MQSRVNTIQTAIEDLIGYFEISNNLEIGDKIRLTYPNKIIEGEYRGATVYARADTERTNVVFSIRIADIRGGCPIYHNTIIEKC